MNWAQLLYNLLMVVVIVASIAFILVSRKRPR